MDKTLIIPDLGEFDTSSGLIILERCSDGIFVPGRNGVVSVTATGDRKVEFIAFPDHTLAYVKSAMDYPAYYPVHPVCPEKPVKAVLMDLDGTSVRSEEFWIWIIEQTTGSLLQSPCFHLETADLPYVSGHSVSEHLNYCIEKYCPEQTLKTARQYYFEHTHRELQSILDGGGNQDAFTPAHGLKDFLLELKERKIKIGLVTSGLYEKAWPEIVSAFHAMQLGDPSHFYDAIITAGFPLRQGSAGTLGELSPKPHPWLYAEVARVGLGMPFASRNQILGIEDSGAGVCSIRLAGFPTVGIVGGNIRSSGTQSLCTSVCETFADIVKLL